jgi:hypothetical protein
MGDAYGQVRQYHASKTKLGITKLIDLKTFYYPGNEYLIDDTCVFVVEVFIIKSNFTVQNLKMMNQPATYYYSWKLLNFQLNLMNFTSPNHLKAISCKYIFFFNLNIIYNNGTPTCHVNPMTTHFNLQYPHIVRAVN